MRRLLAKIARQILPPQAREPLRRWLAPRPDPQILTARIEVRKIENGFACDIDGAHRFTIPSECYPSLAAFTEESPGRWEFWSVYERALAGNSTLLDVGAFWGMVSVIFCSAHSSNRAVCVEPSPIARETLQKLLRWNGLEDRVRVEPAGVGATAGELEMLIDPVGGFVQSEHFPGTMLAPPKPIRIPILPLAAIAEKMGSPPGFLKVDVEGFEWEVISGAREWLASVRPIIFLELHLSYLERRGKSPRDIVQWLIECGYRFRLPSGEPLRPSQVYDCTLPILRCVAEPATEVLS